MEYRISIVGLGKLGACMSACFAAKGFRTIGIDINKEFVDCINNGDTPVIEPFLQDYILRGKENLEATQDSTRTILDSDTTFLVTPTPSQDDGSFSDRYLLDALKPIAISLGRSEKAYHLFVISSTVSPKTVETSLIPVIEENSKRKLNKDFGVCYSPRFIALGKVINDFLNPNFILIGESDDYAGKMLSRIYLKLCDNSPPIVRMSIVSAEIVKIALNAYITMKISFANFLANVCSSVVGVDIDKITNALGYDKRIGPSYVKGGPAYGGPCFPRDNRAFSAFTKSLGYEAKLAMATDEINKNQNEILFNLILKHLPKDKSVSIIGLAYKTDTPVIEESAGVIILQKLLRQNIKVTVFDPLATKNIKNYFGSKVIYADSIKTCFSRASLVILFLPLEEAKKIDQSYIGHNPTTIIDCWRILDQNKMNGMKYIAFGKYNDN